MFSGNRGPLDIKEFAVLTVVNFGTFISHEFPVVRQYLLKVLIGADILQSHLCLLCYLRDKQKKLKFGLQSFSIATTTNRYRWRGQRHRCVMSTEQYATREKGYKSITTSSRYFWRRLA